MKIKFSFLIALSAMLVAGCAAYYSVFGLSQLFAGASTAVIIMASSLEFSKIVVVSLLQRYWFKLSTTLKVYLSLGVLILVTITSAGIYGFLSNAYQKTASKFEISEGQLSVINSKKELFEKNILDNKSIIDIKTKRVEQLTNLRLNQESRLDIANGLSNKNRARTDITQSTEEIQKLNSEIDALNLKNSTLLDSVNFYLVKAIDTKSKDNVSAEIGPLLYISQLTNQPMDKVVNWFILLLIFVFDPLAVALVMATNRIHNIETELNPDLDKNKTNDKVEDKKIISEVNTISSTPTIIDNSTESEVFDKVSDYNEVVENDNPVQINEIPDEKEELIEEISEIKSNKILTESDLIGESDIINLLPKKEPVIPTGVVRLEDIKEIKESRGFSTNIPNKLRNLVSRIK